MKIFLSFWFKMNCLDIYSQAEEQFPLLEVLGHEVLLLFFWERVCSVTMAGVSTVEWFVCMSHLRPGDFPSWSIGPHLSYSWGAGPSELAMTPVPALGLLGMSDCPQTLGMGCGSVEGRGWKTALSSSSI